LIPDDDDRLLSDLKEILDIYSAINLESQALEVLVPKTNYHAILSKPFLLLAGISGTGKTRFVREQAKASGSLEDTYCLTSVRPDWLSLLTYWVMYRA
jgi:MoxR-like ATPase